MALRGDNLIAATDMGHIEIFDYKMREKLKEISIPDIKDFMGDTVPARVMSVDEIDGKISTT